MVELVGKEEALHHYRICVVSARDKKMGRPRRTVLFAWDGQTPQQVAELRRIMEPKLSSRHVAELDHVTVARGPDLSDADVQESEPAAADSPPKVETPSDAAELAHKMLWDAYSRDAAAMSAASAATHEANQQTIEHGRQLLEHSRQILDMYAEIRNVLHRPPPPPPPAPPPPPPPRSWSMEEIERLVTIGVKAIHGIMIMTPDPGDDGEA